MMQTEYIDSIVRRYQTAGMPAWIATDRGYDRSFGEIIPSSGTAIVIEQRGLERAKVSLESFANEFTNDIIASTPYVIELRGDIPSEASNTSIILDFIGGSAKDTLPDGEVAKTTVLTDALQEVVDLARNQELHEISDRLIELGHQPFDDDELPLQAASADCFLEYCLARQKQARPLMTVTPAGELDATWKGPDEQSQVMRFFPNGSVWVAFKLSRGRGSFEAIVVTDLLDPDSPYNIPDWA